MNSKEIYEIPEINNIITGYVKDLEEIDILKEKFKIINEEFNGLEFDIHYDLYNDTVIKTQYIYNNKIFMCYNESEVCVKCGNFYPYSCDISQSSTMRQFCKCFLRRI